MDEKFLLNCADTIDKLNTAFTVNNLNGMTFAKDKPQEGLEYVKQRFTNDCQSKLSGKILDFLNIQQKSYIIKWAKNIGGDDASIALLLTQKIANLITREKTTEVMKSPSLFKLWRKTNEYNLRTLLTICNPEEKQQLLDWLGKDISMIQIMSDKSVLEEYVENAPIQHVHYTPNHANIRMNRLENRQKEAQKIVSNTSQIPSRHSTHIPVSLPSSGGHRIKNLAEKKNSNNIQGQVRSWAELQSIIKR